MMEVLLAIDDSKFSEAALEMLIAQNRPEKTRVRVLRVVELVPAGYYPELVAPHALNIEQLQQEGLKQGRALTERVAERLRAAGFKVETAVEVGSIRTMVVDVAAKW